MTDASERIVIPGRAVRRVAAPVVVECTDPAQAGADTMTVIPLVNGDRVEGFEVRCQCGSSVVVECLYQAAPE